MNGIHDCGGMQNLGAIPLEVNEPVFHADWEKQILIMTINGFLSGEILVDNFRHEIEKMPAAEYLLSSYYEHWVYAIEHLLIKNNTITREALEERMAELAEEI